MTKPGGDTPPTIGDSTKSLRWSLYAILIAAAVGQWSGRILAVDTVNVTRLEQYRIDRRMREFKEKQALSGASPEVIAERVARKEAEVREKLRLSHPFLSSNDRSRWAAIRALVEHGTFEIDKVIEQPGWNTIDKVRHKNRAGELRYYSSKPPLLYILLAGECWAVQQATGWTFEEDEYAIVRTVLLISNVLPFALLLVCVAGVAERFCVTDWAKVFTVACAAFGAMLTALAATLNNHLFGAVSVAVALYCWTIISEGRSVSSWWYTLSGVACGFAFSTELPALAFLAAVGVSLAWHEPRRALTWFAPGAAAVVIAVFATNYHAHESLRPPYAHRSKTNIEDNWYHYPGSHWDDPTGIDSGEPSQSVYALHTTVGHHGILSLSPVFLLSLAGMMAWLTTAETTRRELALGVAGLTIVVLVFYVGLRPQGDRNYGGMTSGLRWMYWFAPLWLAVMAPAADWASKTAPRQAFALLLLVFSSLSAAYPTWNPWTQPWIYDWMKWCGFEVLG